MPELPEVAALTDFLDEHLRGAVVAKIQLVSFAVLKTADPPFTDLEGRVVTGVRRFGKFVSMEADGLHFVFHLARAGWVRFTDAPTDAQLKMGKGHIAVRLTFSGAPGPVGMDLTEAGTKKSLAVYVVRDPLDVPGVAALGPDPFSPGFDVGALAGILGSSSQQIKGVLRSQSIIAGIGNAYSDEILHAAKTSPFALAKSLDRTDVQRLYDAIHTILGTAVEEAQGKPPNELKDTKRSHMRVHGRTGEACPVCGDTVREVSFADTALQYCPKCQTKGKILADRRTSRFLK
ncbi:Fpg/Nei family DNA glycosylase [Arthrobacter sp. ok362]|uniref:Fpg/Nei family DNA glycosylase n=1 Tax=Arthrobacter sp. ok362 TaxID=1761745 RepID=UPI00088BA7F8|nr:DNA-formamidopyrimidine glycosylase family protein [Arthrobacter sp. ok362]SDL82154.1 formamidopyrimidine-DNA glycosylase [Arthrobacter sp. ok362]